MDVEEIRSSTDLEKLVRLWARHSDRGVWKRLAEQSRAEGKTRDAQTAEGALAKLPEVSALEALAAAGRVVDLLTGWRWQDMRDAREDGATWQDIGDALGITRQSAHELYARMIANQEKYLGDLHDTARSRAVLNEEESK